MKYYQQQVLETLEGVAGHLPRLVRVGGADAEDGSAGVDFLALARELIGESGGDLFSEEDMAEVRDRMGEVRQRISSRQEEIDELREAERPTVPDTRAGDSSPDDGAAVIPEEDAQ